MKELIKKTILLFFLLNLTLGFSQEKQINGNVTDENSQPLVGVSVSVKGTSIGTTCDFDGNYSIKTSKGETLVFSFLGFKTLEVIVKDNSLINTVLQEDAAKLEEIIIRGFRGSEQRAIKVKRQAASVVEAITPADIGNYSDENLADALQRVPGIQIERDDSGNGGGDRVSVRGIGPQFVNITVNGRTPLSGGNQGIADLRQFNLDVLPPEVIQGAVVYKSSEASLVEPGLGGLIDFQTARPLSLKYNNGNNHFAAINVRGSINDYGDTDANLKPRISALVGLKTSNGKLGFFASALTSSDNRAYDATFARWRQQDVSIDGGAVESVFMPQLNYNPVREERDRLGLSSSIQWKPSDKLEIIADITHSDYNNASFRDRRTFDLRVNGNIDGGEVYNGYLIKGDNLTNGNSERMQLFSASYDTQTKSTIGGINVKWNSNNWTISGDASFSNLKFNNIFNQTRIFQAIPSGVSFNSMGDIPSLTYDPAEAADRNNYSLNNFGTFFHTRTTGNNEAYRLDISKKFNDKFTLKFGGRLNSTTIEIRRALAPASARNFDYTNQADPLNYFIDNYLTGEVTNFGNGANVGINSWVGFNHEFVRADNPTYFGLTPGSTFEGNDIFNITNGDIPLWPAFTSETTERTSSYYTQLDFNLNDSKITGNIGLRTIRTEVESKGFSSVIFSDPDEIIEDVNLANTPSVANGEQWDFTPSLNLNFQLNDNLANRFSVVKTISRPDFADLIPTNTIQATNPQSTALGTVNGTATISNPDVKPYSSWQIDNTLEWYNKFGGAFVLSGFYKNVNNFIIDELFVGVNANELGDIGFPESPFELSDQQLYDVTKPVNFTDVNIYGFEIGFRQPLSIISESLKGFGIQSNYTFVDSKFKESINNAEVDDQSFPGSSKHNFNGVIYYENKNLGVRLAYSTRSDFLRNFGGGATSVRSNATYTEGFDNLTARINYNILENLSISVSAENLTGAGRRDYLLNDRRLWNRSTNKGQFYTFGVRYSL